jgi:hypothetical protein
MEPADVAIVFEAAARRPDGRQLGFCFSTTGLPPKASFCDGSGRRGDLERLRGDLRGDLEYDMVSR